MDLNVVLTHKESKQHKSHYGIYNMTLWYNAIAWDIGKIHSYFYLLVLPSESLTKVELINISFKN